LSFAENKISLNKKTAEYDIGTLVVGKEVTMIWTIFVILLVLWLLGLVSSYTMGGFIHILLVLAVIVLVVGLFQRR
jgi:hypothetical protein